MTPEQKKLARTLLKMERLGILDRDICEVSIPLDGEDCSRKIVPPRLFYLPDNMLLVHAVGDDAFYELNPEYTRGGYSKECYILPYPPRFLSNQYALEEMCQGRHADVMHIPDPISLRELRPPPMTDKDIKERVKQIKTRRRALMSGLSVVK